MAESHTVLPPAPETLASPASWDAPLPLYMSTGGSLSNSESQFPTLARVGVCQTAVGLERACGDSWPSGGPQRGWWLSRARLPCLPAEGLPGTAQQVIQVDRDTVLVCFDRECP